MTAIDRFLRYVTYDTQSDEHSDAIPSTAKQKVLGAALAEELAQMGLHNAHMDEYGYVYAWLPATAGCEGIPCVGLIAHMDTSPDAPGAGVKPRVVRYEGGDLVLNEEKGIVMRAAEGESLAKYKGQELIVTDGTTLLGADDKAGVAEIMSAVEYLLQHPELPHGRIAVGFTPDEEVGQGADHFDVEGFGAAVAYTVDGGELGELEYENFNAANAGVYFHGVNIHPGSAKNKMKNAILIALEFAGMLPPAETPAHTEGYEGFYHLHDMKGSETEAEPSMSWEATAPGLPARKLPNSIVPSIRAWGLIQVTTKALAASLGRGMLTSTSRSRVGLSRSRPMPIHTTMQPPTIRIRRCSQSKRSTSAPMPKKQASARLMSKAITIRAVSRARRRGWVRAELMTNRFCIPMGAT